MRAVFVSLLLVGILAGLRARGFEIGVTTNSVSQFQKIEFTFSGEANGLGKDAEVTVSIKTPSGRLIELPAFWFQPFEYKLIDKGGKKADWMYPVGAAGWRARFAPAEMGRYVASASARTLGLETRSAEISFESREGSSPGFLHASKKNPQFFEFENGRPFFALGQNLAFIGEGQFLNVDRASNVFRKMGENGANFARIWACAEDWAMAIEARKSAWGRGWNWNAPIAPVAGRSGYLRGENCVRIDAGQLLKVEPSESVPLRPATGYVLSGKLHAEANGALTVLLGNKSLGEAIKPKKKGEWQQFQYSFASRDDQWWLGDLALQANDGGRVFVSDLSLKEERGEAELLWEADVNRAPRGYYNQPDSFMLDRLLDAAEANGIYLQLCLLTRDHYMADLNDPKSDDYAAAIRDAQMFMRYAVARWGYSTHVFAWEYFNEMDPNAPTQRFHSEVGEYLKRIDPYRHLRTTSGWSPTPEHWKHPDLDIADLHWYLRPTSKPDWRDEISAALDRAQFLRAHATNKPALLGEFGLADDKWGRSPYMAQDKQNVHFHNALWASALSGLSGAAAFWWWEVLDENNAYSEYKALSEFVREIPFTSRDLKSLSDHMTDKNFRAIGLRGPSEAYLWFVNDAANWWSVVADKRVPAEIIGATYSLKNLKKGSYVARWFDTRTGKLIEETRAGADHEITLRLPNFTADIAATVTLEN